MPMPTERNVILSHYSAEFLCRARILIRHPDQREGSRAVLRAFSTAFRCSKNPTPGQPTTALLVGRVSRANAEAHRPAPPGRAEDRARSFALLRMTKERITDN